MAEIISASDPRPQSAGRDRASEQGTERRSVTVWLTIKQEARSADVPKSASSPVGPDSGSARYPIASVANAARIICLLSDDHVLKLSDVSSRLGVSLSAAHRLLTTLEDEQLLSQDTTTRCYVPGPKLVAVANSVSSGRSRWNFALPYLAELSSRVGATVNIVILYGTEVAFVESVEATTAVRVGSRLGAIMPAHCTSGGKALLARLSDDEIAERYGNTPMQRMTAKSVQTLGQLRTELKRTTKHGYATNFGESEPEVSGVAVAVGGVEPYAVAVSAPGPRLAPARVKELVAEIRKTIRLLTDTSPLDNVTTPPEAGAV
jgi:IclR family acetate operon transcriptional repressor